MARELAAEGEPANEDGELSEGEEFGNGGGSERGWISGEDEKKGRGHSLPELGRLGEPVAPTAR